MTHCAVLAITLAMLSLAASPVHAQPETLPSPSTSWRKLVPGIELGLFPAPGGQGQMQIVRVDARSHPLRLCSSSPSQPMLTVEEWAAKQKLCLVINAGMYDKDGSTHCGYLKNHDLIGPAVFRSDYSSICVFTPRAKGAAPFRLLDTDDAGIEKNILSQYAVAVQNLRLIKHRVRTAGSSSLKCGARRRWGRTRMATPCSSSAARPPRCMTSMSTC